MGSGEHGWGSAMTNDNDGYTPIAGWFLLMLAMLVMLVMFQKMLVMLDNGSSNWVK
jgi:hypothetical protein